MISNNEFLVGTSEVQNGASSGDLDDFFADMVDEVRSFPILLSE